MNVPALLSVFGVAFVSLWASVPVGIALRLHPVAIMLTATLAYAAGVAVVVLPGQHVRDWLVRKLGERAKVQPDSLLAKAWNRFGYLGLAFLAPVTTGAQVGALIGLAFQAPPGKLMLWMTAGGAAWSALLTLALSLGLLGLGVSS